MFVGLTLVLALQVTNAPADVVRELEHIEQRLGSTYQKGDCDGWASMLAPEWSVTHVNGQVITRDQGIETCKAPRPPIQDFTIDDVSVRAYGDAAVVTGRTRASTAANPPQSITLRFTDVFIRRDGRWLVVASQATQISSRN